MNLYTDFFNIINATLSQFIGTTTNNAINAVMPVGKTLLLISVGWFGWSSIMGVIDAPIKQVSWKLLQISVIFTLATNVGIHNQYISDWLWQSPDALANVIVQGVSGSSGSISSISFLDDLLTKFDGFANQFNQKSISFSEFGASISNTVFSWVIWIVGILLTAYAAFLFLLSKIALAVLLGISPIFIILTMFQTTKKFFDAWIGQVLNYIFLPVLTAAVIAVVLTALNAFIAIIPANGATQEQAIALIALSGTSFLILTQVPSVASTLGGGVALSTLNVERWAGNKAASIANRTARGTMKATGKAVGWGVNKYRDSSKNSISKKED